MNTKTTLFLAITLAMLGGIYFIVQARPAPRDDVLSPPPTPASVATRDLFEAKLGEVAAVAVKRRDGEEWAFTKEASADPGPAVWRMTKPFEAKCASYVVDRFGRTLGGLNYEISYAPGDEGSISAADAGLDPPRATVTVTDKDGVSHSIEIGNQAGSRQTYVRKKGEPTIYLAKADLKTLLKDHAIDYRDPQLWNFAKENVQRVEIDDRSDPQEPKHYVFARDGARWMIESPVTGRATSKIDDMLSTMARMSIVKWEGGAGLAGYGLEPAALTVRATVEEEVPAETSDAEEDADRTDDDAEAEKAETAPSKTKTSVFVLHLSNESPIGEDTKVYARVGDESAVATVMKSVADKFKPVMADWRDMHLTSAKVKDATRVEVTVSGGTIVMVKKDGAWSFEPDGGRAEASAVTQLLTSIAEASVVAFVDPATSDMNEYGLDPARASIRLTIPGAEQPERITIGAFTDEQTKRLVYARRGESTSIAKIRTADVDTMLRNPIVYRDRTIIEILPSRFERIWLSTPNPYLGTRGSVTLDRLNNTWTMSAPIKAELKQDQVDKLVEQLGGLRADQVVTDGAEVSAYGLHAPSVAVSLAYKPPVEQRVEKGEDDKPASPIEIQPQSKTIELAVAEHDGKYYAKRADRPTIYEVSSALYRELTAEYRADRVLSFDDAKVVNFSVRHGDATHVFEKHDGKWVYRAEPDLPLDQAKVKNLLIQIGDLRTHRYVAYTNADYESLGLSAPTEEVTVTIDGGVVYHLLVSGKAAQGGSAVGVFAAVEGRGDAFILTADAAARFAVSLDELEAK